MNIYFAGSIKGSPEGAEMFPDIIELLGRYGDVLTEHLGKVHQDFSQNIAQTDEGIFQADKEFLDRSDIVVAEITGPSHGVGWEIAYSQFARKIPVLCLYKEGARVSSMLIGNPGIKCRSYSSLNDIEENVNNFIQQSHVGN